ncbi:glycosyltransferase family protein [Longirhabdus pacifica]|uniref:glycosyltransferase family protein n=1 Tax=Longirhabdus pacifica TaxID=2305227 RepID=UPI0013E8A869|nr:glycosyltransferase family protein [Longirhabdus pacifica]
MHEKEIAVLCCVHDDRLFDTCRAHLEALYVPDDYELSIHPIYDAEHMTVAYNEGMKASKAKYKIYVHQDCYIIDYFFIKNMLHLFQAHEQVGMIGLCGTKTLPEKGIWWEGEEKFGHIIEYRNTFQYISFDEQERQNKEGEYVSVQAIDGLLMATQYDIPWNENIKAFHFYDTSQSLNFHAEDLDVVIPYFAIPPVIHDIDMHKFKKEDNDNEFTDMELEKYKQHLLSFLLEYRHHFNGMI